MNNTPRQRIILNGEHYRALVPKLKAALDNADRASESGNLSYFIAALQDVAVKADTLGRSAATLARLLRDHGIEPKTGAR